MVHSRNEVRAAVNSLTDEQIAEYLCTIDQSLWLEYQLDLPSICSDRGQALADYADDLIQEML